MIHFKSNTHDEIIEALMGSGLYSDDDAIVDSNSESQQAIAHYECVDGEIVAYTLCSTATIEQAQKLAKLFEHLM